MRCLSLRPPWSLVVADGRKTIENRPRRTNLRERILIHSSLNYNSEVEDTIRAVCRKLRLPVPTLEELRATPLGAIIGAVTIVDCLEPEDVPKREQPWVYGRYCYVLEDAQMFKKPIPWRGALGFFHVPDAIVRRR